MLIEANGKISQNWWRCVDSEVEIANCDHALVSWELWSKHCKLSNELNRAAKAQIGVVVEVSDPIDEILQELATVPIVVLNFEAFSDGRHFSTARLIKERSDFRGELRAAGAIHLDQLFYLFRVGFDTCELAEPIAEHDLARALASFSSVYQPAGDSRVPAFVRRRAIV